MKLALPFYGGCHERCTVRVHSLAFLAEANRYIDEQGCVDFATRNPALAGVFSYRIFRGATHTFDHATPNLANIEASSRFDASALAESQRMISAAIDLHLR